MIDSLPVHVKECPEEMDKTVRTAIVGLRTTDLGMSRITSRMEDVKLPTDNLPIDVQHWALVFYFKRGHTILVIEGCNVGGKLVVFRSKTENMDVIKKSIRLGEVDTSPEKLLEMAKESDRDIPYHLLSNNCQTWLKRFLQDNFLNTFSEFEERYRQMRGTGTSPFKKKYELHYEIVEETVN